MIFFRVYIVKLLYLNARLAAYDFLICDFSSLSRFFFYSLIIYNIIIYYVAYKKQLLSIEYKIAP